MFFQTTQKIKQNFTTSPFDWPLRPSNYYTLFHSLCSLWSFLSRSKRLLLFSYYLWCNKYKYKIRQKTYKLRKLQWWHNTSIPSSYTFCTHLFSSYVLRLISTFESFLDLSASNVNVFMETQNGINRLITIKRNL